MSYAAEQCVIGGILLSCGQSITSQGEQILTELKPASFADPNNRRIWKAIQTLASSNEPIDVITVDRCIQDREELQFDGSFAYLADIASNTPSAANIQGYAKQVKESGQIRWLEDQANQLQTILKTKKPHDEKLSDVNALTARISAIQSGQQKPKLAPEVYEKHAEMLAQRRSGAISGLTLGIKCLDDLFAAKGGINRNDLIMLAARPKMGKTQLAAQIANHIGLDLKLPVLIFTLEMEDIQLYERMASAGAKVPGDYFYGENKFVPAIEQRLDEYGAAYTASKILTDDRTKLTLLDVQATVRQMIREHGELGLVMIDYHSLMQPEKADRTDQGFGAITKGLKQLAKETHSPVLLLAQVGRGVESRQDKRPLGSDLRETGQAEQDLDRLIVLYREAAYNEHTPIGNMTEVIVRLNRHGRTGTGYMDLTDWGFADLDEKEVEYRKSKNCENQGGWNG